MRTGALVLTIGTAAPKLRSLRARLTVVIKMNVPALRTITPAEIQIWFGNSKNASSLTQAQYSEIAAHLTRCRWPSDPPAPGKSPRFPRMIEHDSNKFWDFKAAIDAMTTLRDSIPAMLSHWEGQQWAPETRQGYELIQMLGAAISKAAPYIEWPFGHSERRAGRKKRKGWHLPAVIFANLIIKELVQAGHDPGITRNSVVVRVVFRALHRMNFPNLKMITHSAIGMHLARWDKEFGLTPRTNRTLTTK
jgi:hypothetical protein